MEYIIYDIIYGLYNVYSLETTTDIFYGTITWTSMSIYPYWCLFTLTKVQWGERYGRGAVVSKARLKITVSLATRSVYLRAQKKTPYLVAWQKEDDIVNCEDI